MKMKTKNNLFLVVLIFSCLLNIIDADILYAQSLMKNSSAKDKKDVFQRLDKELISNKSQIIFYPFGDGDFWEYITADTTTLIGQFYDRLNFSITKEITGDTLLTNGIIYKKVKWENIANSVNYPEWYDYHRVDTSGNIYLFYEGSDYLLFDFSLAIGQSYSSHLPDQIWKIADRYEVIGFGDTLQAIDFELLEQGIILKEKYTIVENFGIVYYQQNIDGSLVPEGNFWGAVINGEEYGTMIATKQTVDWSEFYPLHIGDYWVYEGESGSIPFTFAKRIIDNVMMPDNYFYFLTEEGLLERIDSTGNIFHWNNLSQESFKSRAFSSIIGDTIKTYDFPDPTRWRVNEKYISQEFDSLELNIFLYPDIIYYQEYYTKGFGLTYWTIEGGWGSLKGALVNGVLYGDTTITGILRNKVLNPYDIKLYQNYPNPFNPSTNIDFIINETALIKIKIYNYLGKEIKILLEKEYSPGNYTISWEAKDSKGNLLPSGVYLIRLSATGGAGNYTKTIKALLLK